MLVWASRARITEEFHNIFAHAVRTIVEVRRWEITVSYQYQLEDGGEWHAAYGYYTVCLSAEDWMWGRSHAYYDGPHDMFSLGPLHLCWQKDWCERCWGNQ